MNEFLLELELMFVKTAAGGKKKEICYICFKSWSAYVEVKMEILRERAHVDYLFYWVHCCFIQTWLLQSQSIDL